MAFAIEKEERFAAYNAQMCLVSSRKVRQELEDKYVLYLPVQLAPGSRSMLSCQLSQTSRRCVRTQPVEWTRPQQHSKAPTSFALAIRQRKHFPADLHHIVDTFFAFALQEQDQRSREGRDRDITGDTMGEFSNRTKCGMEVGMCRVLGDALFS